MSINPNAQFSMVAYEHVYVKSKLNKWKNVTYLKSDITSTEWTDSCSILQPCQPIIELQHHLTEANIFQISDRYCHKYS